MKYVLLACALLLAPASLFAESGWKEYVNARFGFKVSYPATLIAGPVSMNGDGREFHTKDKEFSFSAEGHFLNGETLESFWERDLRESGTVTYKKKAANWYVVSGVNDGSEFYHTLHVQNGNWAELRFLYPHAKAKQYDPWVEKIVKDFVPFLKGDYDRIVK